MTKSAFIPAFDLSKKIENEIQFDFEKLEASYTPYNSRFPHRHRYYEIIFFEQAGGDHEIDFRNFKIRKDCLHFISPEQVHLLRRKSGVKGVVISFGADLFLQSSESVFLLNQLPFFDVFCRKPIVHFKSEKDRLEVLDVFKKIEHEFHSENKSKSLMILFLLSQLLILCERSFYDVFQKKELRVSYAFR